MKLYICFTADLKIYYFHKRLILLYLFVAIFLMEVINLAGLPDVGNTEKSRNL